MDDHQHHDVPACSLARSNTVSVSQRLKPSLSMNCLKSWLSSFIIEVITRSRARSCSMRAFSVSEFLRAFLKAVSAATRDGMVAVAHRAPLSNRLFLVEDDVPSKTPQD